MNNENLLRMKINQVTTWKTTIVPTAAAAWAALGDGGSPAGLILVYIKQKSMNADKNTIEYAV